jgi:hypothetical protein
MIKIGLIISPFLTEELIKEELIEIQDNPELVNEIEDEYQIDNDNKIYTTNELIIINYLRRTYKDVKINIINPTKLHKMEDNDIVFVLTFDIIEAFHTLPYHKFKEYKKFAMNYPNIYPNYSFQKLINFKNLYFKHLINNNINVLDHFIIENNEDYRIKLKEMYTYKERVGWDGFIIKPLYGQESIGFKSFHKDASKYLVEKDIEHLFKMGFPGVIFQEFLKSFGESKSEYRVYFIKNKYMYTVETGEDVMELVHTYKYEPDEMIEEIINFAKRTVSILPNIIINDIMLPHLMLRIDIGYDDNDELFVNEVEFVPSLYTNFADNINMRDLNLHELIGDTIYEITAEYVNKNNIIEYTPTYTNKNNMIVFNLIMIIIILFFIMKT